MLGQSAKLDVYCAEEGLCLNSGGTSVMHAATGTLLETDATHMMYFDMQKICGRPMGIQPVKCNLIDANMPDEECLVVADAYKVWAARVVEGRVHLCMCPLLPRLVNALPPLRGTPCRRMHTST